jgi:putative hydrolase of the HAD superfamily
MDGNNYWRNVLAGLGHATDDESVAHLREVMRRVWWARIDRDVLATAGRARSAGVRLALLSNSAPEHEPTIAQLIPLVDVSHFSHRTGRRKPDRAAYEAVAEDLELPVGACLFVDDKRRNVDAAVRVGMSSFVFTSALELERELAGRGLLSVAEGTC